MKYKSNLRDSITWGQSITAVCKFFVCCEFFVPLENFSLIWRRHHYRWRASNLTYTRPSRPSSREGSSTCHSYCGFTTAPPPKIIFFCSNIPLKILSNLDVFLFQYINKSLKYTSPRTRDIHICCGAVTTYIKDKSIQTGDRTPISCMRGERTTTTPPRRWSCLLVWKGCQKDYFLHWYIAECTLYIEIHRYHLNDKYLHSDHKHN